MSVRSAVRAGVLASIAAAALGAPALASAAAPPTATVFPTPAKDTNPDSMTLASDGNMYFLGKDGIYSLSTAGQMTQVVKSGLPANFNPNGSMTEGPDKSLWFSSSDATTTPYTNYICKMPLATDVVTCATLAKGSGAALYITAANDGKVYFSGGGSSGAPLYNAEPSLSSINPATMAVNVVQGDTSNTMTLTNGFDFESSIDGLTLGSDGNLWFTDKDSGGTPGIGRFIPGQDHVTVFPTGPGTMPNDISAGPGAAVYFSDDGNYGAIGSVQTDGTIFETRDGLLPAPSMMNPMATGSEPDEIEPSPDGKSVWFIDQEGGDNQAGKITPSTTTPGHFTIQEFPLSATATPWTFEFDPDGNVWFPSGTASDVPDPTAGEVQEVTPSGTVTQISMGLQETGADNTSAVIGPDGNLYYNSNVSVSPDLVDNIVKVTLALKPLATTGAASAVTTNSASIAGTVTPRGTATTVSIQYGNTMALGSSVTVGSALNPSLTSQAVTGSLTGLPAGTTIYYAVSATNAAGTTTGPVQSFVTTGSGGGGGGGTPPNPTTTTASVGGETVSVTVPGTSVCTKATTAYQVKLAGTFTGHGAPPKLSSAQVFLDKGVKSRKRKVVIKHGHRHVRFVTTFKPNATVHHLPATVTLNTTGLTSGNHTIRVKFSFKVKVKVHGHVRTKNKTKTVVIPFSEC